MLKSLLRVKPVEPAGHIDGGEPFEGSLDGEVTLKRTLTARHLILLGMGAVIGAFVMGVMNNGMSILGIGIDWQQIIKGMVLVAAVFVDVYNKNK